jgi:hypothetical protein
MDLIDVYKYITGAAGGAGLMAAFGWPALKSLIDNRLARGLAEVNSRLREVEEQNREKRAEERTRQTVAKKYTRVLLLSASDLQDRLWHLCAKQFVAKHKVLLANEDDVPMYGSWPMTKRHYLVSTLYLFARYFCWIEILRSRERFLELQEKAMTHDFDYHLKRVERTLAETSLQKMASNRVSTDRPIFQLMQTEIGQSMRVDRAGEEGCLPFCEFRLQYDSLLTSNEGLGYLQILLTQAMSGAKSNFCQTRLRLLCNALLDQQLFLLEQNGLVASDSLERLPILEFDYQAYLKLWPARSPVIGPSIVLGAK